MAPIGRTPQVRSASEDPWLAVRSVYQPIVDLRTRAIVGYEALARWPARPDVDPESVFHNARTDNRLDALEWACRLAAVRGALGADMQQLYTLFVNIEADATPGSQPDEAAEFIERSTSELRVMVEVTERALLTNPSRLLAMMSAARKLGFGVALDDVGSNPDSLTIMEFVAPDVVKLDRRLIRNVPTREEAKILTAVAAYSERTPATVLAEGIETPQHLERALSIGATLGQGWLLGRPTDLATLGPPTSSTSEAIPFFHSSSENSDRLWNPSLPSDLFDRIQPRVAGQVLLSAMTRSIEDHALSLNEPSTIISTFQHASHFTSTVAQRYAQLARINPFVAVMGLDMLEAPAPGVRGVGLDPADPLCTHWVITVVGQHFFAAMIARQIDGETQRSDATASTPRRFEYLLTYDHDLVVAAARSLASRLSATVPAGIVPRALRQENP